MGNKIYHNWKNMTVEKTISYTMLKKESATQSYPLPMCSSRTNHWQHKAVNQGGKVQVLSWNAISFKIMLLLLQTLWSKLSVTVVWYPVEAVDLNKTGILGFAHSEQ